MEQCVCMYVWVCMCVYIDGIWVTSHDAHMSLINHHIYTNAYSTNLTLPLYIYHGIWKTSQLEPHVVYMNYIHIYVCELHLTYVSDSYMGWLRFVGSIKL